MSKGLEIGIVMK